jgi:FkbM family methyltransferase
MTTSIVAKVQHGVRLGRKVGLPRFIGRLAAWRVLSAAGVGATVPFARYHARFYCPPRWRGISKMAYTLRDQCEPELLLLDQWVADGDLVVDVGAHYGSYTVPLAQLVGPTGVVVAVEPSTHALPVLRRNLQLNRLTNVEVVEAGAGETPGRAILHLHADPSRASLHDFDEGGASSEAIPLVRVDDIVPASRSVSFLKIDVEGYELPAPMGRPRAAGAAPTAGAVRVARQYDRAW